MNFLKDFVMIRRLPIRQVQTNQDTAGATPGLMPGEPAVNTTVTETRYDVGPPTLDGTNLNDAGGRRVRLRPKPDAAAQIYGQNLMAKQLTRTKGMVWPYQPTINYSQEVDYTTMELIHTNQEILSYARTKAPKFTVEGTFTVQSQEEGLYASACLLFLKTVTKMYFGDGLSYPNYPTGLEGTPPPILIFDAYGQYMFNNLPVVVTSWTASLPNDVDYMPIDLVDYDQFATSSVSSLISKVTQSPNISNNDGLVWLPVVFTISVQLTVQNTPKKLRKFNLDAFRNGSLISEGGWI